MTIDYSEKIPNNVNLSHDRTLQRALEHWQPHFLDWWREMGPNDFASADVYLRTATGVDAQGWASYGAVKMPDYRWGIFLADAIPERKIGFGDSFGEPVWQQVPGEFRSSVCGPRRAEPPRSNNASAGHTCPSLYDLRNLFQVNVEEGRHLWAMVYLLHAHSAVTAQKRKSARASERCGQAASSAPSTGDLRLAVVFLLHPSPTATQVPVEEPADHFDPLARTCRFMLTEEAHHMFVGETGIGRVFRRTSKQ